MQQGLETIPQPLLKARNFAEKRVTYPVENYANLAFENQFPNGWIRPLKNGYFLDMGSALSITRGKPLKNVLIVWLTRATTGQRIVFKPFLVGE